MIDTSSNKNNLPRCFHHLLLKIQYIYQNKHREPKNEFSVALQIKNYCHNHTLSIYKKKNMMMSAKTLVMKSCKENTYKNNKLR